MSLILPLVKTHALVNRGVVQQRKTMNLLLVLLENLDKKGTHTRSKGNTKQPTFLFWGRTIILRRMSKRVKEVVDKTCLLLSV
jgi:hypothetical protein